MPEGLGNKKAGEGSKEVRLWRNSLGSTGASALGSEQQKLGGGPGIQGGLGHLPSGGRSVRKALENPEPRPRLSTMSACCIQAGRICSPDGPSAQCCGWAPRNALCLWEEHRVVWREKLDWGGRRMCLTAAWPAPWMQERTGCWRPADSRLIPWTPPGVWGPRIWCSLTASPDPKALILRVPRLMHPTEKEGLRKTWMTGFKLLFTKFTQTWEIITFE